MTQPHIGRYVRRIPRFEPPAQEPPVQDLRSREQDSREQGNRKQCARHRPHVVPRATPHDGRSGRLVVASRTDVAHGDTAGRVDAVGHIDDRAHRFAEAAVRLVLEVVDGRRPVTQLAAVLEPTLVDAVTAARTSPAGTTAAAVLLRTRLRAVDAGAAELFGTYTRGPRVHAVAGRIVRATPRARTPHGWTITTLWLSRATGS